MEEVVGGDGTTGGGSAGRDGVSKVSIGIGAWTSGVGAGSGIGVEVGPGIGASGCPGTGIGASCCGRSASDVPASNPGAGLPLDSAESWFVFRVVGV